MRRRFQYSTPDDAIARLDRLLWVMEGIAAHGWTRGVPAASRSQRSAREPGDRVVARWTDQLSRRVDAIVDGWLAKLEEREDRVAPHQDNELTEVRGMLAKAPDRRDRCPSCGTRQTASGTF